MSAAWSGEISWILCCFKALWLQHPAWSFGELKHGEMRKHSFGVEQCEECSQLSETEKLVRRKRKVANMFAHMWCKVCFDFFSSQNISQNDTTRPMLLPGHKMTLVCCNTCATFSHFSKSCSAWRVSWRFSRPKKREIFVVKNSHQDFRESFMGTRHDFLTQWSWLDHLNVVSPILNQIRHLPFVTALISLISWLNSTAFSVVRSNRKCDPTRVNGVEQLNKSWWWCGLTSCSQSQYVYIYIS